MVHGQGRNAGQLERRWGLGRCHLGHGAQEGIVDRPREQGRRGMCWGRLPGTSDLVGTSDRVLFCVFWAVQR